jgi:hypothetical protein
LVNERADHRDKSACKAGKTKDKLDHHQHHREHDRM